jgi:DNA-binding CsgD family transcriptional regulator
MKIKELAPMNMAQYASHFVPIAGLLDENHPNPLELFQPTIDAVKKLAFAPYFWFIADYKQMKVVAVDAEVEKHIAHSAHSWLTNGHEITTDMIHPEDLEMKIAYDCFQERYLGTLPPEQRKYLKFNTFFRVLDPKGLYRWYMVQMPDYHYDANGNIVYSLRVAYDISHLRKDGVAMMTMLDDSDPQNQIFLCQSNGLHKPMTEKLLKLTDREMEIIRLLAAGQLSKQIAGNLGISPHTVENHKQNIFKKTDTRSASELVAFAIRSGIA